MTFKEVLIQLSVPETYPVDPELYPSITHCQLVNFTAELPRPNDDKNGYLNIWVGKGYIEGGKFRAACGLAGIDVKIEEPEIFNLNQMEILAGMYGIETMKFLSQYLIDTGRILGTVIINEYGI